MDIRNLNFGIIHSIVGKNDGVSIVIDQTVKAMVEYLSIPLGNIHFLAAYAPSRFNTKLDEIFWHKNEINRKIVKHFSDEIPPEGFEHEILQNAQRAKKSIENWVNKNRIDFIVAHNTSHPYNFTSAMGLGLFLEEKRKKGVAWPKCLVWWHDSYYERPAFEKPGKMIKKYLKKYLPGQNIDGAVFINSEQPKFFKEYWSECNPEMDVGKFLEERTAVIPNTSEIKWSWKEQDWDSDRIVYPPQEQFNETFMRDIGLEDALIKNNKLSMDNAVFLLQHTRIVPRKRIDKAIDLAFMLAKKFKDEKKDKFIVLLVSGHSGDEQAAYKEFLQARFYEKCEENDKLEVFMFLSEDRIFSCKDIVVDKKYYSFDDIPSIIASKGGIGTYFSEIEGFGNNLLEMVSHGLPAIINRYEIFKSDIERYGFIFPAVDDCEITEEALNGCYRLLTDNKYRNKCAKHNLEVLEENLSHKLISEKLKKLLDEIAVFGSV